MYKEIPIERKEESYLRDSKSKPVLVERKNDVISYSLVYITTNSWLPTPIKKNQGINETWLLEAKGRRLLTL